MEPATPHVSELAVARKARIAIVGSLLGAALALVNEVACARFLGLEAYGLYALALVLARIAETLSVAGLSLTVLRELPVARSRGDEAAVSATLVAASAAPLVLGSMLGLLLWNGAEAIAAATGAGAAAPEFIRAAAWAVPFMALSEVLGAITRGLGFDRYYVIVRNLVPPMVFGVLLLALSQGAGPPAGVAAAFAAAYAAAAIAGVACVRSAGGRPAVRGAASSARALYGYAWPILANNLLYLVVGTASILLLALYRGDAEVGLLRASMQVLMPFEMVELAFVAALGGAYPVLAARGDRPGLRELAELSTRWISVLALALLAAFALARHDILRLMGPGFGEAATALLVLLAGQAILLCTGGLAILLVSCGRQRVETGNVAAAALLGVVLNLAWIPHAGILGAAFATAIPCVLVAVLRVLQARRCFGLAIWHGRTAGHLALPALAALAAVLLSPHVAEGAPGAGGHALRAALLALGVAALFWWVALDAGERRRFGIAAREAIGLRAGAP